MKELSRNENQTQVVTSFEELVSKPFEGTMNALCWQRELEGDFAEIVGKLKLDENLVAINEEDLITLELSEAGQLAREVLINDLKLLKENGASPTLNLIKYYDRDDSLRFFPTDVYSFHVDRSPIPTHTYLCTYSGEASEILPNAQAEQKVLIPALRQELKKLHSGTEAEFESFLSEYFFDLHYQAKPDAQVINLGKGNLWRLAVDFPGSPSLPCIHRAPEENSGEIRLMLIC